MTRETQSLIESLSRDVEPVKRSPSVVTAWVAWFVLSWIVGAGLMYMAGPFRPGFVEQLIHHGRFLFECIVGVLVVGVSMAAALGYADPHSALLRWLVAPASLLVAGWIGLYAFGLSSPALEPSMLGKREGCVFEVLLYSVPCWFIGVFFLWRYASLSVFRVAWLSAVGAAAVPALLMQLACMYDPAHILMFHVAPIGVAALVLVPIGLKLLPRV